MRRRFVLMCLLSTLIALPSLATTILVPDEYSTIQAGVDAATAGDTVLVSPGTYTGSGNTNIGFGGNDLSLIGVGGPEVTVIDCTGAYYGIHLYENESNDALIQGFTIQNAEIDGIHCNDAAPTLRFLNLSENERCGLCCSYDDPILEDVVFVNNDDGAISCYQSSPHLMRVSIFDHISGHAFESGVDCHPILEDVVFVNNYSGDPTIGSIVYCTGALTVNGGYFYNNVGHVIRGNHEEANLQLNHITMVDNSLTGIICTDGAQMTLTNSTITGCGETAIELMYGSVVSLSQSIITFNGSLGIGTRYSSTLNIECSNVYGNSGGDYGGELADQTGLNGNIKSDPLFCQVGGPDLPPTISVNSPCAPANNDCGLLMGANEPDCNLVEYLISGRVTDSGDAPLEGVTISGHYFPTQTDLNGDYQIIAPEGWSGTLTPTRDGFHFNPPEREISPLTADLPAQNFLAYTQTTIYVPGDFATISAALEFALSDDTVLVAPGIYTGPQNRELTFAGKNIILLSEGGPEQTIIDCEGDGRGFHFHQGEGHDAVVSGFTVRNGLVSADEPWTSRGGGILVDNSSPTLRNLIIEDCTAVEGMGAGIHLWESWARLEDLIVRHNRASGYRGQGGGISCQRGSVIMERILLHGNFAHRYGGGLWCDAGELQMSNSTIANNRVGWSGGAIGSTQATYIQFTECILYGNEATSGGALYHGNTWYLPGFVCCDVYGNTEPMTWGIAVDPVGQNGNFAADPHFCDPAAGDFRLADDSPCLPPGNDCGVLIGAFGEGCTERNGAVIKVRDRGESTGKGGTR